MAQFASDAFGGTEGTELNTYDSSWTEPGYVTGNIEIASGRARASSTTSGRYIHSGVPASADYSVTATLYKHSEPTSGVGMQVLGRHRTDANTFWRLGANATSGSGSVDFQLFKCVTGTFTQIGSTSTKTQSTGTSKTIELKMVDDTIEGYFDGEATPTFSTTQELVSGTPDDKGRAGIGCFSGVTPGDAVGLHLDNFSADDISSGVTGTGSLTTGTTTTSGTGTISHTGTGTLTTGVTTLSGTGTLTHTGTGALTTLAATLAGAGVLTHVGTGDLTTAAVTVSGSGTVTQAGAVTGTGALTIAAVTASGTGTLTHTGTGDLQTSVVALAGAGVLSHTGTGDLTTGVVTVSGLGEGVEVETPVVGGGIGHGGFARKTKRFVKVEEAESPEEVIAAIESALSESTKKPVKRKAKAKVSPKPVETPSVNPGEWLDYFREQSRLVREQQAMNDLIARAKLKIQELQAQETLRRLEELQFIQQQEEEMLLLLMAA